MIRSQLNSYSGADPIWGFVALIASERFTGGAAVGIDPRVRLFAVDGHVYFAEREGDAPIGTRLVNCGVVSTRQLEHGAVEIGDTSSLARLFQREPSIDRDAVELTIGVATESLLESVAQKPVGMPEVFPLRHHSSGLHHWLRSGAVPASTSLPVLEEPVLVAEEAPIVEAGPVFEAEPVVVEAAIVEAVIVEATVPPEPEDLDNEPAALVGFSALTVPTFSLLTEPIFAEPAVEVAVFEEPVVVEDAVVEEAVVEEAVVEEAVVVEEPVVEEAVAAEPAVVEEPVVEEAVAAEPAVEEAVDGESILPSVLTLASLTLPSLPNAPAPLAQPVIAHSDPAADTTVAGIFDSLAEQAAFEPTNLYKPVEPLAGLPKLMSAPVSMTDLAAPHAAPASPFGEPTHNLAAVDIWEMVDVLTDDGRNGEQELVGSGGSDKRGRGWLRGRKS